MIKFLLYLSPVLPPTPANVIHIGEHLPPIVGERTPCNSLTGFCMSIPLRAFLQLKDIAQNSPDLCKTAVETSAAACAHQTAELADVITGREVEAQKVIDAYQVQLDTMRTELSESNAGREKWKTLSISASVISVITLSILTIQAF